VGDGEDLWREVLTVLKEEKAKGSNRNGRIRALGNLKGIYLPAFTAV